MVRLIRRYNPELKGYSMGFPSQLWLDTLDVWRAGQTGLPEATRWKKFIKSGRGARPQNSLQHTHAITFLAIVLSKRLRRYTSLDTELIFTAVHVHDHGEGETELDVLYIDKDAALDLREYEVFARRFSQLPDDEFVLFQRAFLLQFCLKEWGHFPRETRSALKELAEQHRTEALFFEAVERWDYVIYALEQFQERGNKVILIQTLRHQVQHLDRLARDLPGFGDEVWTEDVRAWFQALLDQHEGQWIEQPGETVAQEQD